MSNATPRTNQLQTIPPKDADKNGKEAKKPVVPLEEDDEFEDFPVEGILTFDSTHVRLE